MQNSKRRSRYVVILVGLFSLVALLWSGGKPGTSIASAIAASSDAPGASACTEAYNGPSFGSDIVVGTNEVECGTILAFGGSIALQGEVRGSVIAFNSDVVISGTIDGNVKTFGGSLVLLTGCYIHGNIDLYGTEYAPGTHPSYDGHFSVHTNPMDWLYPFADAWSVTFWSLLIWEALGLVIASLFPEHVLFVRTTLTSHPRRGFLVGLLSLLLAPIVLVVLIALVISLPIAIIVAAGLIAAWALGTVSVGWLVGEYITKKIAPQHNTRLIQVAAGMAALALAGALPVVGGLITVGAGMIGLGAVFLSRFGTRLYGQPRRPLHL
jgi:hypothetical protein